MDTQMNDSSSAGSRGRYRIGAVSQLTGVSPDTIRAWERRYRTVKPVRSEGGSRLYSEHDVARLQLMKALTECGEPIGTIARLSDEQLRHRLAKYAAGHRPRDLVKPEAPTDVKVAVLDSDLSKQVEANRAELVEIQVAAQLDSIEQAEQKPEASKADVVVANIADLGHDASAGLDRLLTATGARTAIVTYDFAPRRRISRLAARGVRLIKRPVTVAVLRQTILDHLAIRRAQIRQDASVGVEDIAARDSRLPPPERLYDDSQLARLRELRSSIDCECPNHLASIITNLVAFERYSHRCMNEQPDDSEMHGELARGTAHARSLVEQMLTRLCHHDGIKL
jgi:DNA-binding transcriptional MerR regulator